MNSAFCRVILAATCLAAGQSMARDYFVATNGVDSADGQTWETARRSIAEGVALLTQAGDRLVVGDGEFNLSATTVLDSGKKLVSAHGRTKTRLVVPTTVTQATAFRLFDLTSAGSEVNGFTIDFNRINYRDVASAGLLSDPTGILANCEIRNYYTAWGKPLVSVNDAAAAFTVSNCVFRNCQTTYRASSAIYINSCGPSVITDCSFVDCQAGASYFSYGCVFVSDPDVTMRNCQFVRCKSYDPGTDGFSPLATLFVRNANAVVENCAFIDCEILGAGNGAGAVGPKGKVFNTFAYRCLNASGAANLLSGPTYSHCASDTDLVGEGHVKLTAGDLEFLNERGDRYTVLSGPIIDAGVNRDWMAAAVDINGQSRIANGTVDIGCSEFSTRPRTLYVAVDGDDDADGLTRGTAKATIPAAVAALRGEDERVLVTEGDYDNTSTEPFVLSNGWSVVGEKGAEKTRIRVKAVTTQFDLKTRDTAVCGLTFDFEQLDFFGATDAGLTAMPMGCISGCVIENYYSHWGISPIRINGREAAPLIENCTFRNCQTTYRTPAVLRIDGESSGTQIVNCRFIDCIAGVPYGGKRYFGYGIVYHGDGSLGTLLRNCLFYRCESYDAGGDVMGSLYLVYARNSHLTVENVSFVECVIPGGGTGSMVGPYGQAANTLAYGCTNNSGSANLTADRNVNYSYCASDVALPGTGNVLLTPDSLRFRHAQGDLCTVVSGPTIDAGLNKPWMAFATDLHGKGRIVNGTVDIGSGEYDPSMIPGFLLLFK